jgi:diguanylate cyclase
MQETRAEECGRRDASGSLPLAGHPPDLESLADAAEQRESRLRFARGLYTPRALGLALGFCCVGSVLLQDGAGTPAWIALLLNAFVWPHAAWLIAARSANPRYAELRNLMVDSGAGGAWIAVMGFNVLPSVLAVAMLAMNMLSAGGPRLLLRGLAVQATACMVAVLILDPGFRPTTTMFNVLACLPLLVTYPVIVGLTTHRLSRRLREQNRQLAELSRLDGLTQLLNRAHWEHAVAIELKRHERNGRPVALLMFDIDRFKSINDRHGHVAGDEVIRNVATLVRETLREQDTAGRYGGEEFGVVLPDTNLDGASVIAERLRQRIETALVESRFALHCTISIGVAEAGPKTKDVRDWIDTADRALYAAKAAGRNRTVRADGAEAKLSTSMRLRLSALQVLRSR